MDWRHLVHCHFNYRMDNNVETYIKELSQFKHRYSGTGENRRAMDMIKGHFVSLGWRAGVEHFKVYGVIASAILLHVFLVLLLYWLPVKWDNWNILSMTLYGLVLVSFWGEMTLTFHWLRRLIPFHRTANVEARFDDEEGKENQKLIIVSAHHDSPKTGWIYHEKLSDPIAKLLAKSPPPFNRFFLLPFVAFVVLGIAGALRWAEWLPGVVPYLAWFSTGVLGLTSVLVFQWWISAPSQGANDNGSGVLVLMELARRFSETKPKNVSIRLLATGAEEVGFVGIKEYINEHYEELSKRDALFLNIECVGGGELHWGTSEGFLVKTNYPRKGLETIETLEQSGTINKIPRTFIMSHTDSAAPARKGFGVVTLIGLKDKAVPANYHKASDTFDRLEKDRILEAADLIERVIRKEC